MSGDDLDALPPSALQQAAYCLRHAALIHLDCLWAENRFTGEADVLHAMADKGGQRKLRGMRRVLSLLLAPNRLNLIGTTDLVEFSLARMAKSSFSSNTSAPSPSFIGPTRCSFVHRRFALRR